MKCILGKNTKIGLILSFILFNFSFGFSQHQEKFETPGDYTFIVPPCVTEITVKVWGGGAGGGGTSSRQNGTGDLYEACTGGGGGGAGGFTMQTYSVIPGETYMLTVGAGGAGGVGVDNNAAAGKGEDGGESSFGGPTLIFATGGTGGGGASAINTSGFGHVGDNGIGGVGGMGQNGSDNFAGGNGSNGSHSGGCADLSGAGGGAPGESGAGENAEYIGGCPHTSAMSGGGGKDEGGNGGNGIKGSINASRDVKDGHNGESYGGGGGGGNIHLNSWANSWQKSTGGNGANGAVIIEYDDGNTPDKPVVVVTESDCEIDGTATITNYSGSYNYTFNPSGPSVNNNGEIIDFDFDVSYTVSASNGQCDEESEPFKIEEQLSTPNKPAGNSSQSFCDGAVLSDIAVSGTGISWYSDENLTNEITNPSSETLFDGDTYYATSSNGDCESDFLEVEISIGDVAAPTLNESADFCDEAVLSDVAVSGTGISWYSDENLTNEINNPSSETLSDGDTYYATSSNGDCESDFLEVEISIGDVAAPTLNESAEFCDEAVLSDVAVSGTGISWYSDENLTNEINNPSSETLSDGDTYYATSSNGDCESDFLEVEISIGDVAAPTLNESADFCDEAVLSDVAVSGTGISWYSDENLTNEINNPSSETLSDGDTYYATSSNGDCESDFLEVEISIGDVAAPTLNESADFCDEAVLSDVAVSGTGISWYSDENLTNEINNPSSETLSDGDTYYATSSNGDCESDFLEVEISIGDVAAPTLNESADFCDEAVLSDVAVSGTGISWYSDENLTNEINNPSSETLSDGDTYYATSSNGDCESDFLEVEISIGDVASPTLNESADFCDEAVLSDVAVSGTGISWYSDENLTNEITNPSSETLSDGDTYYATSSNGDCESDFLEVEISIGDFSLITITSTNVSCYGVADGTATVENGGSNMSYSWDDNNQQTSSSATGLSAGEYTVTITDDDLSCFTTSTVTISEPDPIAVAIDVDGERCGENNGSIELFISGGNADYQVEWNNGETGAVLSDLTAGTYAATITDANGCSKNIVVDVPSTGGVEVEIIPPNATVYAGEEVDLEVIVQNSTGNESYSWTPSEGLSCDDCPNPTANPTETTSYHVTVTNEDGCSGSDYTTIIVMGDCGQFYIPNMFSPNNDGRNDYFRVYGNKDCVKEFRLQIFDRWGSTLYETEKFEGSWNGKLNEKFVNSGGYIYKVYIKPINGKVINESGNVELVR